MVKVLTAIFVLKGGLLFVPSTASAANETATFQAAKRGCVTRAEFRRVKRGMEKARVHRIFDTRGKYNGGVNMREPGRYARVYKPCRRSFAAAVTVEYAPPRHRVLAKIKWKRWHSPLAATSFEQARRGCVTRAEFRRVRRGMTKARVHRIFDTRGRFADGGAGGYSRVYRSCDFRHAAYVEYRGIRRGPDRATGWKRWTGASFAPTASLPIAVTSFEPARYRGTINKAEYRRINRQWRKFNLRREIERMANVRGRIIWRDRDRGSLAAIVVRYRTPKRGVVVQIAYIHQRGRWVVNDIGRG
jgi:hypothetical protein